VRLGRFCEAIAGPGVVGEVSDREMIYENREARKSSRKTRDERQGHNRYRAPDGAKMRVTSRSWDGEKVILRDQVLEVSKVEGRLHVARKPLHHRQGEPAD
jgi:hypothetical protein